MNLNYELLDILQVMYPTLNINITHHDYVDAQCTRSSVCSNGQALMFSYSDGRYARFLVGAKNDYERKVYLSDRIVLFNDIYKVHVDAKHIPVKRRSV